MEYKIWNPSKINLDIKIYESTQCTAVFDSFDDIFKNIFKILYVNTFEKYSKYLLLNIYYNQKQFSFYRM